MEENRENKVWTDGFLLSADGTVLYSCTRMEDIVQVPETVQVIAESAFSQCPVRQVLLPMGLRQIQQFAFFGCKELVSVSLPEGLEEIGSYAFGNTGLTELVIPQSVKALQLRFVNHCRMGRLTILGKPQFIEQTGANLSAPDAEITADALAFEVYPSPYRPIHGLRSFARRWLALEDVPPETTVRFRSYLKSHYREHWTEPQLLQLNIEMRVIPAEEIDSALADAMESGDPAITAALLAYQREVIPRRVLERIRREGRVR